MVNSAALVAAPFGSSDLSFSRLAPVSVDVRSYASRIRSPKPFSDPLCDLP